MKTFFLFVINFFFSIACFSQGSWTELKTVDCNQPASEIPIKRYDATGFGVGNKVFYSSGVNSPGGTASNTFLNDLYEFDLSTNLWVQKNSYPGLGRNSAFGFDFNNFGYLILGANDSIEMNDCWKYDYILNSWTQLNDFPGLSRSAAFTFFLNNKFYIGGGITASGAFINDFWEYDPTADIWIQKNRLPKPVVVNARSFSTNSYGYFVGGTNANWGFDSTGFRYDPIADAWTSIPSFPEGAVNVSFSGSNGGYGIFKNHNYFYDESSGNWILKNILPETVTYSVPVAANGGEYFIQEDRSVIHYDFITDQWEKIYHGLSLGMQTYNKTIVINDTVYSGNWKYIPAIDHWTTDTLLNFNQWLFSKDSFGYAIKSGSFKKINPVSRTWTTLAPLSYYSLMFSFEVGQFAYVGIVAYDSSHIQIKQFWMYDILADVWTRKMDFPGSVDYGCGSFASGNNGYVVGGVRLYNVVVATFWKYDSVLDNWSQLQDIPGGSIYRPVVCMLNGKAIVAFGGGDVAINGNDVCNIEVFDPLTELWTTINYPFHCKIYPLGFSFDNKLFIGFGEVSYGQAYTYSLYDFWKYDPLANEIPFLSTTKGVTLFPNPVQSNLFIHGFDESSVVTIYNTLGKIILSGKSPFNLENVPNGIYVARCEKNNWAERFVVSH